MRIALFILVILLAFGALWLEIGLFALVVAPALGFFLLLTLAPLIVDKLECELQPRAR